MDKHGIKQDLYLADGLKVACSTVCLVVIRRFAIGDGESQSEQPSVVFLGTDLTSHLGVYSDIRYDSLWSILEA